MNVPVDPQMEFGALRKDGLEHVRETSREIWSDYNLHDPGVTLLEQTCYALGELAYRADLPIADLLTSPNGTLDHAALALPHPRTVLATAPVTLEDLELRLGSLPGVAQVSLVLPEGKRDGLVDVDVLPAMDTLEEDAARRVGEVFHSERPLGLALRRLTIVRPTLCMLSAEIEISPGSSAEQTVARIFHLAKGLSRHPVSELPDVRVDEARDDRELTRDSVFDAPELLLGRPQQQQGLRKVEQALRSTIFQLPGVKEAHSIKLHALERHRGSEETQRYRDQEVGAASRALVTADEAGENTASRTEDTFIRVLMPTTDGHQINLTVRRAGETLTLNPSELVAALDRLLAQDVSDLKTPYAHDDWELPGPGRPRDFAYNNVDADLPSAYSGAGSALWGSTRADAERAFAPLRKYRTIIDQVVASMTEDLKSLPGVLAADGAGGGVSAAREPGWSYAAPAQPPLLGAGGTGSRPKNVGVNVGEARQRMNDSFPAFFDPADVASAVSGLDPWADRRCRALDYLLALQGEQMPDSGTAGENAYVAEGDAQIERLKRRVRLLGELPVLNRSRGCGPDILAALPSRANRRGFPRKLALVLDLPDLSDAMSPLSAELDNAGIAVTEDAGEPAGYAVDDLIVPHDPLDMLPVRSDPGSVLDLNRLKKDVPFLESGRVSSWLLRAGARLSNYVLAPTWGGKWRVLLDYQSEATNAAELVSGKRDLPRSAKRVHSLADAGIASSKREAIARANRIQLAIELLNRQSEGVHCIEHKLLGSASVEADARKVSLVFAGWTLRYKNDDFRQHVREQAARLAPAHLLVNCYFVEADALRKIEAALADWRTLMAEHAREAFAFGSDHAKEIALLHAAQSVASEIRALEAAR